ncbi:putative transcriptional regulator, Sigma-54 dependent family [Cupriavidus phytorum]|uniref:Transcriptional regulator, Sigma-54 dependent family n=2 Tax=Cupriavidus TaxID=106589 RepID=A0A976ABH7_9BURK|nr:MULTISPECIES: sigma-54-dependent Fis family transcriptional regulator [Cupriavidus]PZX23922.1 transcriptional regulator of acetoin/glycerol metabolism [Cupriavidus alkaliphilus]SOY75661.1 putative transcriptional regulator, Sigma-54 dependent family [Cupriavidus taiwanensis]
MTIQPDPHPRADAPADAGQHERAELIAQAHQRSESYGLRPYESPDFCPVLQSELKTRIERSQSLFTYALPVMETLHDQIVDTQSMIVLTDADGLILHAMGDDDFLARADKISLRPGSEWSEARRGTNAIGTALAENRATLVHGADHYLEANQFLTCSCMPILDPYGKTVGALDVTGDQRGFHKHTMALVRMSAQMIENQLFGNAFRDMVCIRFHSRAEFLGTLVEGIVSFTPGGRFLSANRSGQFQLGLSIGALQAHTFSSLFGLSMSQLFDAARAAHAGIVPLHLPSGVKVSARVEWKTPAAALPGGTEARPAGTGGTSGMPRSLAAGPAPSPGLDELDTGDAQIRTVIGKLRKVIGKDIPVMVLGETGTGKELMARAIHADSGRRAGPFIAVNCASIPENLIESELFGYEEGAFTGARKKGGIGKMLLANGGTLFLDEIGDMPLHLQGRLLRALQERAVSPLGSSKVIHIDVSVVCATNRNLRDLVASGQFREDLYYRLNGLVVRLPALRERSDLDVVAGKLLRQDHGSGDAEVPRISDAVMALFRRYHWPGNIRQLGNLLRTARLMAEGEAEITEEHLPDDFLDDLREAPAAAPAVAMAQGMQPTRLAEVEAMAIVATVKAHNGNISAAAKALGISRNTVYRKMEEARGLPQQAG